MSQDQQSGKANIRPRSKYALKNCIVAPAWAAAALLVLALPAAAQHYGGGKKVKHGHASNADGGLLTNLTLSGTLTPGAITINPGSTVSGSTITLAAASKCSGLWCVVASSRPAHGTSQISFAGLSSSTTYRLTIRAVQLSAVGHMRIQFNGDTGANYRFARFTVISNGSTGATGSAAVNWCHLQNEAAAGSDLGVVQLSESIISTNHLDNKKAALFINGTNGRDLVFDRNMIHCHYAGGSAVTSIQLTVSAGMFTGAVDLEALR